MKATTYGLFIDLNEAESIQAAIQFKDESSFNYFAEQIRNISPMHEVGIKNKDGSIEVMSLTDFRTNFFENITHG